MNSNQSMLEGIIRWGIGHLHFDSGTKAKCIVSYILICWTLTLLEQCRWRFRCFVVYSSVLDLGKSKNLLVGQLSAAWQRGEAAVTGFHITNYALSSTVIDHKQITLFYSGNFLNVTTYFDLMTTRNKIWLHVVKIEYHVIYLINMSIKM